MRFAIAAATMLPLPLVTAHEGTAGIQGLILLHHPGDPSGIPYFLLLMALPFVATIIIYLRRRKELARSAAAIPAGPEATAPAADSHPPSSEAPRIHPTPPAQKRALSSKKSTRSTLPKLPSANETPKKAPQGQEFRTRNGRQLTTVGELATLLKEMSDEEYSHHVTPERNDFAAWIKHSLHFAELATKVEEAQSKQELLMILETRQ